MLYRSPASKHSTPEFRAFLINFKRLHSNIQAENPFATFFTDDFNAHSQSWWSDGDSTNERIEIDSLFTSLGLTQVISEPTNFGPNKNPSCIDLIITDQPNLILDCGIRASLDPFCHHQIIYCKVNFRIPPPPPFERNIWHFNRANTPAITKSMASFPWVQHLNINADPNWQVKTFHENLLNIMMNFVPNETKTLKTMLNRKNKLFKNYKSHGYKEEDKSRVDAFRIECQKAVENAKSSYLSLMGDKVNKPGASQKSYWKIINRIMTKCRAPKIPPLINNRFVLDCKEKTKYFKEFFSQQCKPIMNNSVLPNLTLLTDQKIENISVENCDVISLIRNINPNKASGSDGISGQMLLICDETVVLIFRNIIVGGGGGGNFLLLLAPRPKVAFGYVTSKNSH